MTSSDMRLSFVDIRRRPRANRRDRLCPVRGVLEIAREKGKAMRTTQRLVRLRRVVPPGKAMRIPQLRKRSSLLECCLSAGRDRLRPVRGVFTGLLNIRQAGLFW